MSETKVGPGNNFELAELSGSRGSIRKLVSKNPFSHHKRLSGYARVRKQLKINEIWYKTQGGRGIIYVR